MSRLALAVASVVCLALTMGKADAQYDCDYCPSCYCPQAPSCDCPATTGVRRCGCDLGYKSKEQNNCNSKNIEFNFFKKTVTKSGKGNPFFGEEPPMGFAVSSMPVLNISTNAVPIDLSARRASIDIDSAAALARAFSEARAAGPNTASAASGSTCEDPCGDIKQLQQDVEQLKELTYKLTVALDRLSLEHTSDDN